MHACIGVCLSHIVCCARCRIEAYPGKGSRDKSPVASLVQKYEDENAAPVRQITPSSMLLCGVPTCLLSICEHFKCAQCQALWLEKAFGIAQGVVSDASSASETATWNGGPKEIKIVEPSYAEPPARCCSSFCPPIWPPSQLPTKSS